MILTIIPQKHNGCSHQTLGTFGTIVVPPASETLNPLLFLQSFTNVQIVRITRFRPTLLAAHLKKNKKILTYKHSVEQISEDTFN